MSLPLIQSPQRILLIRQLDCIRHQHRCNEDEEETDGKKNRRTPVKNNPGKQDDRQRKNIKYINPFIRLQFDELPLPAVRAFLIILEADDQRIEPTPLIIAVMSVWHWFSPF